MISENLTIRDSSLNYRDCVSYYFARWFDEPFTVDVLNNYSGRSVHFELAPDELDRQHIDYLFTGLDNRVHYVDSKTHIRNFHYLDESLKEHYFDVITVGENAWTSQTEFFSFVHKTRIYLCYHAETHHYAQPVKISSSKGQNNHKQNLYHFSIESLKSLPHTTSFEIPKELARLYADAYDIFERNRNFVYDILPGKTESQKQYAVQQRLRTLNTMKDELLSVIKNYNACTKQYDKFAVLSMISSSSEDKRNGSSAVSTEISNDLQEIYSLLD